MAILRQFPALAILILIAAGLMVFPALHAARAGHLEITRVFLTHGSLGAVVGVLLGLSLANRRPRHAARYHLTTILLTYTALPLLLAAPLAALAPGLGVGRAYRQMLSSLTTTGATVIGAPGLLPDSLHLWRALIGWVGGFMVLIATFSVLAPLNLGGFEIREREDLRLEQPARRHDRGGERAGAAHLRVDRTDLRDLHRRPVAVPDRRRGPALRGGLPCDGHDLDERRLARGRAGGRKLGPGRGGGDRAVPAGRDQRIAA